MPDYAIRVENVSKTFGTQKVLDGLTLDVLRGETLVILGGSGSGKSTLLRLMIGNERPDSGRIRVAHLGESGRDLCDMSDDELDDYRRSIGVLFQSGALYNSMSVAENVALPLREHSDTPEDMIRTVVTMKLQLVGLRAHAAKMPSQLSGGMKKRAGLARALVLDPKILFYDEPSAGLDPVTSAQVDNLIMELNKGLGVTSVVVTHEMDSAFRIADRMVLLHRGRFIASGTPDEMRRSSDKIVDQFINGKTEGPLTDALNDGEYQKELLGG